tara:strand:+ start:3858 stop:4625 length:768 start_codon:yes stop_codon:yes gene_type:complete
MLFEVKSINLSFKKNQILNDISLDILSGELVGILGPNGSGKTSFLKILGNIINPNVGEILIDTKPLKSFSNKNLSQIISYLPQEIEMVWPLSVEQVISLGLIPYSYSKKISNLQKMNKLQEVMKELDLSKFSQINFKNLSTGEKARTMVARALISCPKIFLADEPIASLDPYYQLAIMDLLKSKAQQGLIVIVALHDLTHAGRYCDKLILLNKGSLIAYDEPVKVLTKENISKVYNVNIEKGDNNSFFVAPFQLK